MPLSTRRSAPAQRIVRAAFEELQRIISASDHANLQDTTLEGVRQAAYQIESQLRARNLILNMRRLVPLFSGLEDFSRSIEILCTGTPYLPWLWAPIKLVLKIASSNVEAMEKIIKAYSQISVPLGRFRTLNRTFSNNAQFQQALALFYADIVSFHKEAYQFVRRSDWEILFLSSWGRFQRRYANLLENLKEHENLVDKTAAALTMSDMQEIKANLDELRRENLEKLAREEEEQTAGQYLTLMNLLNVEESDQVKIFDGISDVATMNGVDTNNWWLLRHPKIRSWIRNGHETTFLVLHGSPGTGKSVLATQLTSFLRAQGQSLAVSHFCTYSFPSSTLYDHILRSILIQIIRTDSDLIAYVYDQLVLKKKSVRIQLLEQLLRACVAAGSPVPSQTQYIHLILDGLDECNIGEQKKLITLMERIIASTVLSSQNKTVCKILILSSSSSESITRRARNKQFVHLSDEKHAMEQSIRYFANSRLGRIRSQLAQTGITDNQISEMGTRIAKKADGMFLWAKLVLDHIENNIFFSRAEIIGAVEKLPQKLGEFYGQILMQMTTNFDTQSKTRLRSILGWIAFAKRPLKKTELRSALAFASGNPNINELPPQFIFDKCKPLVEQRSDSTFAFIHSSVRDYLISCDSEIFLDEPSIMIEHGLATSACLLSGLHTLDNRCDLPTRLSRLVSGIHAFHLYSTQHWSQYILSAVISDEEEFKKSLFLKNSVLLSERLSSPESMIHGIAINPELESLDGRLVKLHQLNEILHRVVSETTQNQMRLAAKPSLFARYAESTYKLIPNNCLQSLLENYQSTLKYALKSKTVLGASLQDMERFRQEFETAAYTCFIWTCPFATIGFSCERLLHEHEVSHKRIVCVISMCQYPPFSSTQALENHIEKIHTQPARKTRRSRITQDSKGTGFDRIWQKNKPHWTQEIQCQSPEPAKDAILCKMPECAASVTTYSERAFRRHMKEEHTKLEDSPVEIIHGKITEENIAHNIGFTADTSMNRDQKPAISLESSLTCSQQQQTHRRRGPPVELFSTIRCSKNYRDMVINQTRPQVAIYWHHHLQLFDIESNGNCCINQIDIEAPMVIYNVSFRPFVDRVLVASAHRGSFQISEYDSTNKGYIGGCTLHKPPELNFSVETSFRSGGIVVSATKFNSIWLWIVEEHMNSEGSFPYLINCPKAVIQVALSPNGMYLAVASTDGSVRIHSIHINRSKIWAKCLHFSIPGGANYPVSHLAFTASEEYRGGGCPDLLMNILGQGLKILSLSSTARDAAACNIHGIISLGINVDYCIFGTLSGDIVMWDYSSPPEYLNMHSMHDMGGVDAMKYVRGTGTWCWFGGQKLFVTATSQSITQIWRIQ